MAPRQSACRVYPPAPFRNEPAPAIEPDGQRRRNGVCRFRVSVCLNEPVRFVSLGRCNEPG